MMPPILKHPPILPIQAFLWEKSEPPIIARISKTKTPLFKTAHAQKISAINVKCNKIYVLCKISDKTT